MYKVFINDTPIILTSRRIEDDEHEVFLLKEVDINYIIERVQKNNLKKACLYHKNEEKLIKILKKKMDYMIAAGGMVINKEGKFLFIYRNKKWDLPKGRKEKNETVEEAAIREIEEETGVKGLQIDHFLDKTYHVFKRNGNYMLKITHWFVLRTDYDGKTIPEVKEGIEAAVWLSADEAKEKLSNCYANIVSLINKSQILTASGTNKV